ncbi:MAG: LysM peptidoglycan-binding domain-containing protein [Planctomycetes bacterium]|nr:LysM peptidoglycan-binding domain-containing protein [Planctomycetota bacterium]
MAYGARRRPDDGIHRVEDGETISSIAAMYGFTDWENRVWNHGANAQLKQQRVNPNTLQAGDDVFIPELEEKQESRAVDNWHDFHVVRNKRFLRLQLKDENDEPLANKTYEIAPDDSFRGNFVQQGTTTDADGKIEEEIPHTLTQALLTLPDENLRVMLKIGFLDPLPTSDPIKIEVAGTDVGGAMENAGNQADGLLGQAASAAGGLGGGLGDSLGGAVDQAGSALDSTKQGAKQAFDALAPAVSAAAPLVNAVAGFLGAGNLLEVNDQNIWPAAQRLDSLGFDPGHPKSGAPSAKFTAAVLAFQTWAKQQGVLGSGAGGPLGGIGGAVGGMLLSKLGLSGQLDEETIDALKSTHGC